MAVVVLLASVTPFAIVGTVAAATHTVDASGGADFTSIQAAVDAASAGDIIEVAPGTYAESISVDKQLTIRGDPGSSAAGSGSDAPVIAGGSESYGFLVKANADGTTITGFEISDYPNAILVINNGGGALSDVELSHNDIVNSEIHIDSDSTSGGTMDGITVTKNQFTGSKLIVTLDDSEDVSVDITVSENVFESAPSDALVFNLDGVNTDATLVVTQNTISGADGDGIEFRLANDGTYDLTVTYNTIEGSSNEGVEFLNSGGSGTTATIANNDIRNNSGAGVEVVTGDASGITVTDNNIVDNGDEVVNNGDGTIDAENNYWGSSDGPTSDESNVDTSPYKSSPVSDAGASTGSSGSGAVASSGGPRYDIGDASFSVENPVVGQSVTISVPVTNTGNGAGTFDGMFRSDFTPHDSVSFRLAPGETKVATITVTYEKAGMYNVRLDDEFTGKLTVERQAPTSVSVTVDEPNNTVTAAVENPRVSGVDIDIPAVNATRDSGITLTQVNVMPTGIEDFDLAISQSAPEMEATTNGTNTTILPDGSPAVSAFVFDSSLSNNDIQSVELTYSVNTTRYTTLADKTEGDTLTMYRYDDEDGTYTAYTATVQSAADGSLTATVALDGFSTYMFGVDRSAFTMVPAGTDGPAAAGSSMTMMFEVTNVGESAGMYTPTVTVVGVQADTSTVVLAPGETGTVTATFQAPGPGVWPVIVDGRLVAVAFVEPADA